MSYEISRTEYPGVWQVVFSGTIDADTRQTALSEGLMRTKGHVLKGILVDLTNATVTMSTMEEYRLGNTVSARPEFRGVRIAFLHRPEDMDQSSFLETVEANRGQDTSIQADRADALRWLAGETTKKPGAAPG